MPPRAMPVTALKATPPRQSATFARLARSSLENLLEQDRICSSLGSPPLPVGEQLIVLIMRHFARSKPTSLPTLEKSIFPLPPTNGSACSSSDFPGDIPT